jgi:hypothetical protein
MSDSAEEETEQQQFKVIILGDGAVGQDFDLDAIY